MKVWIISKQETPGHCWSEAPKVAVTLVEPQVRHDGYGFFGLTLIASPAQISIMEAFDEICRLSREACNEIGVTPEIIEDIRRKADPPRSVKEGDTVYVNFSRAPGETSPNLIRGVFAYRRDDLPNEESVPMKVYNRLDDYIDEQQRAKVAKEIAGISPATRKILGLRP